MATVGVRELKNRLSYYLELVKKGEPVTVTARGKEVAVIHPRSRSEDEEFAWRLVREGKATWSGGKPKGGSMSIPLRGRPLSEIVIEEREERG